MSVKESLSLAEFSSKIFVEKAELVQTARNAGAFYTTFSLRKRRGGTRKICASVGTLKRLQRHLLVHALNEIEMPRHVHGCVKRRSTFTNAQPHVLSDVVLRLDLSAFYDSIHYSHVSKVLEQHLHVDKDTAEVLAELTTFQGALPAGAPTSPAIANLVMLDLDKQIMEKLPSHVPYTRYLDDITISGGADIISLLPIIAEVIESSGFSLNDKKTKILRKSARQSVTGVVVNEKASAPKTLVRRIRQYLFYAKKWGLQEHAETHGVGTDTMIATIRGMIGYVAMIDPMLAVPMHLEMSRLVYESAATREENLLELLQDVIDDERTVSFDYEGTHREVAPSEVFVANRQYPAMRGWQLQPNIGWRVYLLSEMSNLQVKERATAE